MTKTERVAALMANEHNPLKDLKALEANTDEGLRLLEVHCTNAASLKAAADKITADAKAEKDAAEAKLKAASERPQQTEEEFLNSPAGASLKTLVEEKKVADAAERTSLIASLKTATTGILTEEQLKAKPIDELRTLAAVAKIPVVANFSGRGIPTLPVEDKKEDFTPPNPYEPELKAMQAAKAH